MDKDTPGLLLGFALEQLQVVAKLFQISDGRRVLLTFDDDRTLMSIEEKDIRPRPIAEDPLSHFLTRMENQAILKAVRIGSDEVGECPLVGEVR